MSTISSEYKKEKLGTFISKYDLSQILSSNNCNPQTTKSYFINPEEERVNRIISFVHKIANLMLKYVPEKIVYQVIMQFQTFLPKILEDFKEKYFTKNHIANYYLALLDYRIALVGSKLSPKHIEEIRRVVGLSKGKSFSFFQIKQVQSELIAAGYIRRQRKNILPPLLKTKVTNICANLSQAFPLWEEQFQIIREKSYHIVDIQKYPRTDADEAALVVVASLFPFFFSIREINHTLWLFIHQRYNMELKTFKQSVYRFRSVLKKEGVFSKLFSKESQTPLL